MDTMQKKVLAWAKKTWGAKPEHLWAKTPEVFVLRHGDNRKWYALFLDAPGEALGLDPGPVPVVELKLSAPLMGSLRGQEGYYPGWHMNREHWLAVDLTGRVPLKDIKPLLELSFLATASDGTKRTLRGPREWLIPANPRIYDIEAGLKNSPDGVFRWKQSSAVRPGDTVYIYVGAPVSAVRYRCEAVETDIPAQSRNPRVRLSRVMLLRLRERYDRAPVDLAMLRHFGVGTVRGPRYMPPELSRAIRELYE